jgi:hypothetical protein
MENWRNRDISRPLTSLVVLVVLTVTATLVYYRGLYGLMSAAAYFGGIALLVAVYLTCFRQWPRLVRYARTTWRERRGY